MSRIRSKGTGPETAVAAIVRSLTLYGIDVNDKSLPGTPDVVVPWLRKIVFVNGCFWHGHTPCYREPKSNADFWRSKVAHNRARDACVVRKLRRRAWSVITVWECELRDPARLVGRIERFFAR